MGWQTLSLPIMPETFNGLANSDLPKRSETFNGLANSDLPIMPETFEKKSMPEGICRIGIRQPIIFRRVLNLLLVKVCLKAFAESEFGNP